MRAPFQAPAALAGLAAACLVPCAQAAQVQLVERHALQTISYMGGFAFDNLVGEAGNPIPTEALLPTRLATAGDDHIIIGSLGRSGWVDIGWSLMQDWGAANLGGAAVIRGVGRGDVVHSGIFCDDSGCTDAVTRGHYVDNEQGVTFTLDAPASYHLVGGTVGDHHSIELKRQNSPTRFGPVVGAGPGQAFDFSGLLQAGTYRITNSYSTEVGMHGSDVHQAWDWTLTLQDSQLQWQGLSNLQVQALAAAVVPEPATVLLWLGGLVWLGARRMAAAGPPRT